MSAHMLGALHGLDEFNVGFLFRLFLGCPAATVQYGMITYFSRKGHGLRTLPFSLVLVAFRNSVSTQQFGLAALAFGGILLAFPFAFPLARLPAASFRLFGFLLCFRSLGTFIGGPRPEGGPAPNTGPQRKTRHMPDHARNPEGGRIPHPAKAG